MKKISDIVLFIVILLLISFPAFQSHVPVIKSGKLSGYFPAPDTPRFSDSTWFGGSFQDEAENYMKRHVGFHEDFIRLNNQIRYWVFKDYNAVGIIDGKEGHRYALQYIDSYFGTDYVGSREIQEKVRKLKMVSDSLLSRRVSLILCIGPGKVVFYPEYIPDEYRKEQRDSTNYQVYSELLRDSEIHYFDGVRYFLSLKDTSRYELFPRNAIHSSIYGNYFMADTLIRFIETVKDTRLPRLNIKRIRSTGIPEGPDKDIEQAMNLIFPFKEEDIAYAKLEWDINRAEPGLRVLAIGDSYYWIPLQFGYNFAFREHEFWYYYHDIHPYRNSGPGDARELNVKEELESNDVVILYINDAQLRDAGWDFIESAYDAYVPKD